MNRYKDLINSLNNKYKYNDLIYINDFKDEYEKTYNSKNYKRAIRELKRQNIITTLDKKRVIKQFFS